MSNNVENKIQINTENVILAIQVHGQPQARAGQSGKPFYLVFAIPNFSSQSERAYKALFACVYGKP